MAQSFTFKAFLWWTHLRCMFKAAPFLASCELSHAALYREHSSFMGREGGFCWTPPFSRGLKERLAVCSSYIAFKIWEWHPSEVGVCWWGGVCFQCMVKWRAMNVLWRKGKEQWGVLISSWRRWVVYSQWNPCSWPRTEGTVFSYTGLGGSGIWKWVKEIHVWACARWFCFLCGCVFLPMFALSTALLLKCFWLLCNSFRF